MTLDRGHYAARLPFLRAIALFGEPRLRRAARSPKTWSAWRTRGVPGHVVVRLLNHHPTNPNATGPDALRWVLEVIQEIYRAGDREVWAALTKNLQVFRRALAITSTRTRT